eukprot:TRINITY_DN19532_c0_g1_i1.p1 TRINITY_DN19532_c0_g1~~TRINITY_DN19532_c0_g1_i1.p1  ORF type:complete len:106 (+),score=13.08 TRINITY_DN19532_c0_g1_i1:51-368(+)
MGVEIEISNKGVELDNLNLTTLLKLMTAAAVAGGSVGVWGGMQVGVRLFTNSEDKRKKAQDLTTYAGYVVSGVCFLAFAVLFHQGSRHRGHHGNHGGGHGHHRRH